MIGLEETINGIFVALHAETFFLLKGEVPRQEFLDSQVKKWCHIIIYTCKARVFLMVENSRILSDLVGIDQKDLTIKQ